MKLISYAQNFEDVMLWRALKHVPGGFYIDIGAHDPRVDSVSRLFYEHEWRGIHVEPLQVYCNALLADRPDEAVLQAAVAAESGVMRLFEIPNTGISTARADIAEAHRNRGFTINEITVPCVTLKHVFDYAGNITVHWLKIDVEGLEEQVLRSWGDSPARPWIVVVESTLPMTQTQSYEPWEQELIKRGYVFGYFDGLNRFYLAEGHAALATAFSVGPNVFDGFSFSGLASTPYCSEVRMQYDAALELKAKEFEAHCDEQRVRLAEAVQSHAVLLTVQQQVEAELAHSRVMLASLEAEGADKIAVLRDKLGESERRFSDGLVAETTRRHAERQTLIDLTEKHSEQLATARQNERDLTGFLREAQRQSAHDVQIREKQVERLARVRDNHGLQIEAASERERALQAKLEDALHESVVLTENKAEVIRLGTEEIARQAELHRREYQVLETFHVAQRDVEYERLVAQDACRQRAADEHATALICQLNEFNLMHERQIATWGTCLDRHADERSQLQELQNRLQAELDAERQTAARLALALRLTHATLSWRLTHPFRALAGLGLVSTKNDFETSNSNQDEPGVVHPPDRPSTDMPVTETQPAPTTSSFIRSLDSHPTMTKSSAAGSLAELLSLSDCKFVDAVYLTLLGRMPDVEGQHYYIDRTRAGFAKRSIISQICRSPEGQLFSASLPGLNELIDEEWKSQRPLVGWLHRLLKGAEGNGPTERRLRAIENQIYMIGEASSVRFGRIDVALETVNRLVTQRVPGQPAAEKIVAVIPDPKALKQCSSKAKSVYAQIKLAATSASVGVA